MWYGLGAVMCLIAAGIIAAHWHCRSTKGGWSKSSWLVVLLLLAVSSLYCLWYYAREFYRLSPDLADSGLALTTIDLISGIALATILIAAGAYRIAVNRSIRATVRADIAHDIEQSAFHESVPGLLLLASIACYSIAIEVLQFVTYNSMLGTPTVARYVIMLIYPTSLLRIAIAVASLQLCWIRWRSRTQIVPDELFGLSARAFLQAFIMLTCIVAVGIPTVRGFAFTLWLGPYDLLSIFGY
jgi:hypothetical protein